MCNLNLPVTSNLADLYSTLDVRAAMNVMLRTAVEQVRPPLGRPGKKLIKTGPQLVKSAPCTAQYW